MLPYYVVGCNKNSDKFHVKQFFKAFQELHEDRRASFLEM